MLDEGKSLAHFRIIKRIGKGGMGEVFLAEDTKLGRRVALKILLSDVFDDAERKERFYREAKAAAGISHPHVMAIHDIGSAPDPDTGDMLDYIVMEYIEGQSLSTYLRAAVPDLKTIVTYAEQIAAGLAAAHKQNIVHRDIKADNIIIAGEDNCKILDFGLAKPITPYQETPTGGETDTVSQELTRAGKILGTVSYMSPEQIRGEKVDTRSDIFSMGILLYRMAAGKLPFEGESRVSTLAKILESKAAPPREFNETIPLELQRIIDKCLEKNPNDRYQDTRDLVIDLRNLRRQYDSGISGISTGITDASQLRGKPSSKSGVKTAIFIILPVILIAIVVWQIMTPSDSGFTPTVQAGENALAVLSFDNKTSDTTLNWLETGLPEILETDLAQMGSDNLGIISRDRVIDCLAGEGHDIKTGVSRQDFIRAAKSLGAKHALSGSFYKLGGEDLRIDARLEEIATGKIIFTDKVIGSNPLDLIDSLTSKIATSLNFDIDLGKPASVTAFISTSPEAYKAYHMAMEDFDKELYDKAIEGFIRAIALDSTFALPYMRIGMAHVFDGRPQEGATWFSRALKYQNKLPNKDATLLDIYADLWLRSKFDDAFVKIEMLVRNHPTDKETRYIYALMISAFTIDQDRAYAEMDTALQLNPQYLSALTGYVALYMKAEKYDSALIYAKRAREYHPESPSGYSLLGSLYIKTGRFDEAIEVYQDMLEAFPANKTALERLSTVDIHLRRFEDAHQYLEMLRKYHGSDAYIMADYYADLANLDIWKGKFHSAMDNYFRTLDAYMTTGDSTLITSTYATISSMYSRFDMPDSAIYYSRQAYIWGNSFSRLDYPLTMATVSAPVDDSVAVLFEDILNEAVTRLPEGMAPLVEGVRMLFRGYNTGDTALVIQGLQTVTEGSGSGQPSNERRIGALCVMIGRYQEGIDHLEKYVEGNNVTSSGYDYLISGYYLGVAEQELGHEAKAAKHFREMLKYWGEADIELKQIKDARERLARVAG